MFFSYQKERLKPVSWLMSTYLVPLHYCCNYWAGYNTQWLGLSLCSLVTVFSEFPPCPYSELLNCTIYSWCLLIHFGRVQVVFTSSQGVVASVLWPFGGNLYTMQVAFWHLFPLNSRVVVKCYVVIKASVWVEKGTLTPKSPWAYLPTFTFSGRKARTLLQFNPGSNITFTTWLLCDLGQASMVKWR